MLLILLGWVGERRVVGGPYHTTRVGKEDIQPFLTGNTPRSWVVPGTDRTPGPMSAQCGVPGNSPCGSVWEKVVGESPSGTSWSLRCDGR